MRRLLIVLFAILLVLNGYAQPDLKRIQVSDDLELVQLSPNAWVHVSQSEISGFGRVSSNGLIFRNGNQAFLFDTPVTEEQTKQLVSAIEDSLKLKVVGFVPNHWHSDCMGGLGWLQKKDIASYANQKTIDLAKENNLPVPKHGFQDSLRLHLDDKMIDCYYFGAAHTTDNIVVWIPTEQILFAGCMAKSLNSQNLGNTADGDLKAYPETLRKVIAKFPDARIVIPGHGQYGGVEVLKHTLQLAEQ
ncbi:MAG: subclass B1 metallo-beta-lactamase [Prolixibacteraceae bacterium]|jgi:metallo-beta-lactamase class B